MDSTPLTKGQARERWLTALRSRVNQRIYPEALNNNEVAGIVSGAGDYPIADVVVSTYRRRLQDISRAEMINSPVIYGWVGIQQSNIISDKGFSHASKVLLPSGKPDKTARKKVDQLWNEFNYQSVTSTGQNLTQVCLEACRFWKIDGECFTRIIRHNQKLMFEHLDSSRFGGFSNAQIGKGNYAAFDIGIDYDKWGAPTKYKSEFNVITPQSFNAKEIIHLFTRIFPEQKRGLPHNISALDSTMRIRDFFTAALVAAKEGAKTKGIVETDGNYDPAMLMSEEIKQYASLSPEEKAAYSDEESISTKEMLDAAIENLNQDPRTISKSIEEFDILRLQAGHKYTHAQTKFPDAAIGAFTKSTGSYTSAGLGVSYPVLFNDYAAISFSAGKLGEFSNQGQWKLDQLNFAQTFLMRVKKEFIKFCIEKGTIKATNTETEIERLSRCDFVGHRWDDLNALATIKKTLAMYKAGVISWSQAAMEYDKDPEELLQNFKKEKADFEAAGLVYPLDDILSKAQSELPSDDGLSEETAGTMNKEPKK